MIYFEKRKSFFIYISNITNSIFFKNQVHWKCTIEEKCLHAYCLYFVDNSIVTMGEEGFQTYMSLLETSEGAS